VCLKYIVLCSPESKLQSPIHENTSALPDLITQSQVSVVNGLEAVEFSGAHNCVVASSSSKSLMMNIP